MADLPEQEQAITTFNTLYTLAKKLEAEQLSHTHRGGVGASEHYKEKFCTPVGRVSPLEEDELFPSDPEPQEVDDLESEPLEGISVWLSLSVGGALVLCM